MRWFPELVVASLVAAVLGCSVGSDSPQATAANAKKLTSQMSETEVTAILGTPNEKITETIPPPMNMTATIWKYTASKDRIVLLFYDGKLETVSVNDKLFVK